MVLQAQNSFILSLFFLFLNFYSFPSTVFLALYFSHILVLYSHVEFSVNNDIKVSKTVWK